MDLLDLKERERKKERNSPVLGFLMRGDAATLRIARTHFKHELATFIHDDVGRPDLDVDGVYLAWDDGLHVLAGVLPPGQVLPVLLVLRVGLAEADAQPALDHGGRVACCAGVEDFLTFRADVADGDEEVDV